MMSGGRPPIAVFVSGSGTNLQALIDAIRQGRLDAYIALVVCNRASAFALERAAAAGIPTYIAPRKRWLPNDPDRVAYDVHLADVTAEYSPRLIVFAGWMHIFSAPFLDRFHGAILNLHPSLLPAFPGRNPVADALAYGARVTGVTVQLIEHGDVDSGPIILQEPVTITQDDTEESLRARIHAVEHQLLPKAVGLALAGRLVRDGRRVRITN